MAQSQRRNSPCVFQVWLCPHYHLFPNTPTSLVHLTSVQQDQTNIILKGQHTELKMTLLVGCVLWFLQLEVTIGHLINELFYWDANNTSCHTIHMLYITEA